MQLKKAISIVMLGNKLTLRLLCKVGLYPIINSVFAPVESIHTRLVYRNECGTNTGADKKKGQLLPDKNCDSKF